MAKEEKNYGFPEKYSRILKKTNSNFKANAEVMSDDELKQLILDCENSISEQEKLMSADTKLQEAKEVVKDLGASYRDSMKYEHARIKYALYILETRGKI